MKNKAFRKALSTFTVLTFSILLTGTSLPSPTPPVLTKEDVSTEEEDNTDDASFPECAPLSDDAWLDGFDL